MRVRGTLTDNRPQGLCLADGEPLTIHQMVVDLVVTVPDFVIVEAEAQMKINPYQACTRILPDYDQLVGLSISRGYTRKIRELFGGPGGCSHVGALLVAMGPVAFQASWSMVTLHDDPADRIQDELNAEDQQQRMMLNANTCHVWVEGGEHITAVALGTDPMRPEWETERLRKLGVEGA